MRIRVLPAVIWTVVILVLCWTPQAYLPVNENTNSLTHRLHLDKFVHAGIFTVFALLWLRAFAPPSRKTYIWLMLAGAGLAAITELVQNLPVINREGEFEDGLADFAGVLFGFPLFRWIQQQLRNWTVRQ